MHLVAVVICGDASALGSAGSKGQRFVTTKEPLLLTWYKSEGVFLSQNLAVCSPHNGVLPLQKKGILSLEEFCIVTVLMLKV